MIRLDNIAKQNGHQILSSSEASAALFTGARRWASSGRTARARSTLFRMIIGR
jgi:hypothetical protein